MVILFRSKSIINIFYLLLLSLGTHFHLFFMPPQVIVHNNDGIFSTLLQKMVMGQSPTILFLIYHAIVLLQAIRINMVLNDFKMFQQNNFTTAMAFVLLTGLLPQWSSISAALVANFLLIWIFIKLCRLFNHPSPKTLLFNTGLLVGFSMLCYHPTAILILVVLFALAVVRPFRLAEWLILLMGILVPYYFLFAWLFLTDQTASIKGFLPYLQLNLPVSTLNSPLIISLSLLAIYLLTGLYYWQVSNKRMIIQIRKNWGVMMVILLIVLPIPFIFQQAGLEAAIMSLVPIAAFAGNVYSYPRKMLLPNILFLITISLVIFNNGWLLKN